MTRAGRYRLAPSCKRSRSRRFWRYLKYTPPKTASGSCRPKGMANASQVLRSSNRYAASATYATSKTKVSGKAMALGRERQAIVNSAPHRKTTHRLAHKGSGLIGRSCKRLAKAVAAISTPLTYTPFDKEKTV